jgi:leucyl-tRNA synthetase
MRWALADAGDGMDDANFETSTANAAILRLTKELAWMEEMLGPDAGAGCSYVVQALLRGFFPSLYWDAWSPKTSVAE